MIFEFFFNVLFSLLGLFAGALSLIPLPVDMINALGDIVAYGVWFIGADFMALFLSVLSGWFIARTTIGLFVFLWDLLPFT